ncbi:acyl-CoA thioesterase [Desulfofundulus thermosubterraneus]|uniref:Acyl-CoA thioester hydrolase n=1 Tax=Desulfofundulus thermosubterraneus DSM 16057 TaxID=1121432 RepID=A0A1M6AA31_9FIRM|nr:acyl-CoA thioesterase [Desulfofundulus thermosubterraneus]SHI33276.1 acyl-CoA thioester hydrolase [Desulfofundulus thermosubterraneus DSM 16057]
MSEQYPFCRLEMEVGWGDCDAAGIAYYAQYFDWFSNGRIQLFKKYGLPYMTFFQRQNINMVALEAGCRYKKSLRPEEIIILETVLVILTRTRIGFKYKIFKKDGVLAAEGFTTHAYVDERGKPFDLKKRHPALWEKINALFGEPKGDEIRGVQDFSSAEGISREVEEWKSGSG